MILELRGCISDLNFGTRPYIFMGFSLLLDIGLLFGSKVTGEFINDE